MESNERERLNEILADVIEAMIEFLEEQGIAYRQREIMKCERIVKKFLDRISQTEDKTSGLSIVQETVERLNRLNKSFKHQLIGTMEREDLCEIINTASALKGYATPKEDLTKNWREW